jgi:translocator protein
MKTEQLTEQLFDQARQLGHRPPEKRTQGIALVVAILLPLLAGAIGGWVTSDSLATWYKTLRKPAWNPPTWLFAPVWTLLYLLMGVASWLVWQRGQSSGYLEQWLHRRKAGSVRAALTLYGIQLLLNGGWSWIFFAWRRVDLALADIVVLWGLTLATLVRFAQIRPLAGWLLVPYQLWVSFAMLLNATIWWLNRDTTQEKS